MNAQNSMKIPISDARRSKLLSLIKVDTFYYRHHTWGDKNVVIGTLQTVLLKVCAMCGRCSLTSLDNWAAADKQPKTRMVELLLSGNRLTAVPPDVVISVHSSLKHLDVSGNLLTTLDREGFPSWTAVERLSLAGNPWQCDCELAWVRRFRFVDNATCWTPSTTTGQRVVCYDADDCDYYPEQYQKEGNDYYQNEDVHRCETNQTTEPQGLYTLM